MRSTRSIFGRRGIRRLPPDRAKDRLELIIDLSRAIMRRGGDVCITSEHLIINNWSLFTRYLINCVNDDCTLMAIRVDEGRETHC